MWNQYCHFMTNDHSTKLRARYWISKWKMSKVHIQDVRGNIIRLQMRIQVMHSNMSIEFMTCLMK